jgi:hypothetical protein
MTDKINVKLQEICDELGCEAWTSVNENGNLEIKIGWSADKPLLGGGVTGLIQEYDSSDDDDICQSLETMRTFLRKKKEDAAFAPKPTS